MLAVDLSVSAMCCVYSASQAGTKSGSIHVLEAGGGLNMLYRGRMRRQVASVRQVLFAIGSDAVKIPRL